LFFPRLRPQRRTERRSSRQPRHSTPTSSSSGEWSRPPSPTTSRLYPEGNLLSGNPADEGTNAEISGDITRPESGTRRSPCPETRPQRWEKPRKSVSSGKGGILDDAIVGELKNRPNKKQSNVGKIPLFGRNLNPDFARALNTPSEVGGVLARIANGLPRTPDAEGYRQLFTRAANHLLPLAHPPNDLQHAINSRRDARSSINASRER
jgi:hypothetical protein